MSQPIRYTPSYNFSGFQELNPTAPLPADRLDTELNNIRTTTDQVCNNLALIQRDDGQLRNGIVTADALAASLKVADTVSAIAAAASAAEAAASAASVADVIQVENSIRRNAYLDFVVTGLAPSIGAPPDESLTFSVSAGEAIVNGESVVVASSTSFTMPDDYVYDIWLDSDGAFHVESAPSAEYNTLPNYREASLKICSVQSQGGYAIGALSRANTKPVTKTSTNEGFKFFDFVNLLYIPSNLVPWAPETDYSIFDYVYTTNGNVYRAFESGTSGLTEPEDKIGPSEDQYQVTDGAMLWSYQGDTAYGDLFRVSPNSGLRWYFVFNGVREMLHNMGSYTFDGYTGDLGLNFILKAFEMVITTRRDNQDYNRGQMMIQSGLLWRALDDGTSAGTDAAFTGTMAVGTEIADGGVTWKAFAIYYGSADWFWWDVDNEYLPAIPPDAHDSLASTFCWLIGRYVKLNGGNVSFLSGSSWISGMTYADMLDEIYEASLGTQIANNLTKTFQGDVVPGSGASYPFQFLEDNCESYVGMIHYAYILGRLGETARRDEVLADAASIATGVGSLFGQGSTTGQRFFVYYYGLSHDFVDALEPADLPWYPHGQSQWFPEYCNLPFTTDQFLAARRFAAYKYPSWWARNNKSSFPDLIGGWLACTKWKDPQKVLEQLELVERYHLGINSGNLGLFITEFAWYLRMKEKIFPDKTLLYIDDDGTMVWEDLEQEVHRIAPGSVSGNAPAFKVYNSAPQTLSVATPTKITLNVEAFDSGNAWDTSASRFQPGTAGYYVFMAQIAFIGPGTPAGERGEIMLYKNGSLIASDYKELKLGSVANQTPIFSVLYLNGTTDYVELWGQTQVSGSNNVYFSETYTWMTGYRLGAS